MRLLGLDFETNGLDTATARITEMGLVLWDVDTKGPIITVGTLLHDTTYPPQPEEILKLTGITDDMLKEFGTEPASNFKWLDSFCEKHKIEYIVAHNGENYDRPLLYAELARSGVEARCLRSLPWIDTRTDIPFASEPDSRKLKHLALDCGFINPFPHRAVFDVLTMLKILSHYDINSVLEYQRIPFHVYRALTGYAERDKAKSQRYAWEKIGEKTWPKFWVKKIKENMVEQEIANCTKAGFEIVRIE